MANSDLLDIWNGAIVNIGARTGIAATTEQSSEAALCALRYRGIVEKIVRETDWNCLRVRAALTEPDSGAVWPPSWSYMYLYPSDCFCLRGFDLGFAGYRPASAVPYEVATDATAGKVILLNTLDPTAVYTAYTLDLTDAPHEAKFDASLREAVAWALAAVIAGPLTGNAQIIAQTRYQAATALAEARAANANESAPNSMDDHQAESLQMRGCVDDRGALLPWWMNR